MLNFYHIDDPYFNTSDSSYTLANFTREVTTDDECRIFELTAPTDLSLGLDDIFIYKFFKDEVDTNDDNTNDAKIHVELATDYAKERLENRVAGRE